MKTEPPVKIQNVVASAALKHTIDLRAVVTSFPDVEYRPKHFPGLIFRLKKPKTTTLIFGSGKMVCTGARDEREARKSIKTIVRKLRNSGIIILGKPKIKVENIVATSSLGGRVDLLGFYELERALRGRIIYEPEQFPGLIYRMNDPQAVILLFSSGKLVCTGLKNEEEACQAVAELCQRVEDDGAMFQIAD